MCIRPVELILDLFSDQIELIETIYTKIKLNEIKKTKSNRPNQIKFLKILILLLF